MKYRIPTILIALCAAFIASAQDTADTPTLESLQRDCDSIYVDKFEGKYVIKSNDATDLQLDTATNSYILRTNSPVVKITHVLQQNVTVTRPDNSTIRVFGDRTNTTPKGTFKEDTDKSHSIKEGEVTYILLTGPLSIEKGDSALIYVSSDSLSLIVKPVLPVTVADGEVTTLCECGCGCPAGIDGKCDDDCDCKCHKKTIPAWIIAVIAGIVGLIIGWLIPRKKKDGDDAPTDGDGAGKPGDTDGGGAGKPGDTDGSSGKPTGGDGADGPKSPKDKAPDTEINIDGQDTPKADTAYGLPADEFIKAVAVVIGLKDNAKISLDELPNKIRKVGISKFIDEWNDKNPDNTVADDQKSARYLMAAIEKGYVGMDFIAALKDICAKYRIDYINTAATLNKLYIAIKNEGYQAGYQEAKATAKGNDYNAIEELRQENIQLKNELRKAKNQIELLEADKGNLAAEKKEIEDAVNAAKTNIAALMGQIAAKANEITGLNKRIKDLEGTVTSLTKENNDLKDGIFQNQEITALNQRIDSLTNANEGLQNNIKDMSENINVKDTHIQNLNTKISTLTSDLTETVDNLQKERDNVNTLSDQLKQAREQKKAKVLELTTAHKAQIEALTAQHDTAINELSTKHETEKQQLISDHNTEKELITADYETKLTNEKNAHTTQVDKLNADHAAEIASIKSANQAKIDTLTAQLSVPRQALTDTVAAQAEAIGALITKLKDEATDADDSTPAAMMLVDINRNYKWAKTDMLNMCEDIDEYPSQPQLLDALSTLAQDKWLNLSGWANKVAILAAYGRIPSVAKDLKSQGIDTGTLAQLYGDVASLLGTLGITLFAPNLLGDTFDAAQHEAVNEQTLIDRVSDGIFSRDHVGYAFDMMQVGYTSKAGTRKPRIKYY